MTYEDHLNEVLKHTIGEVLASPLSLNLLRVYSKLYLHGAQPSYCEKCIREMYELLKKDGLKLAKLHDMAAKRTLQTTRKGLTFLKGYGHLDWDLMSDEQAILLLKKGLLRESVFISLPVGYKQPEIKMETIPEPIKTIEKVVNITAKKVNNKPAKPNKKR